MRRGCLPFVLILLCCAVNELKAQLTQAGCSLRQVHPMHTFNISRFLGRWNEVLWVAPVEEKAYDSTDYFWFLDNAVSNGTIRGYETGRDVGSGSCFGRPLNLTETDSPGMLLLHTAVPLADMPTLYYILDTDYDTYANAYGCYDYSSDRSACRKGRAWLWSRGSSVADSVRLRAFQSWGSLCLDVNQLLKATPHPGHECPVGDVHQ